MCMPTLSSVRNISALCQFLQTIEMMIWKSPDQVVEWWGCFGLICLCDSVMMACPKKASTFETPITPLGRSILVLLELWSLGTFKKCKFSDPILDPPESETLRWASAIYVYKPSSASDAHVRLTTIDLYARADEGTSKWASRLGINGDDFSKETEMIGGIVQLSRSGCTLRIPPVSESLLSLYCSLQEFPCLFNKENVLVIVAYLTGPEHCITLIVLWVRTLDRAPWKWLSSTPHYLSQGLL